MSTTDPKIAAVMERLTATVIESIEAGLANPSGWVPPWHTVLGGAVNATTKRHYQGGNMLMLAFSGAPGPWATYRQWEGIGANVRKGEKGTPILAPIPVKFMKADANGDEKAVSFTRYRVAYVFHADQVEGWNAPETPVNPEPRIAEIESFFAEWAKNVTIVNAPNRAFYNLGTDTISIPEYDHFENAEGYYATFLHEAGHSTAHPSRLNREFGAFGTPVYAKEELIAELTAAFLGQHFNIRTELVDHGTTDYLANWLKALRNDTSLLWEAATQAQKAVTMLLSVVAVDEAQEAA